MEIQYSEKAKFFKPNIFNILNERKAKIAQKGVKVYDLFVGTPDFPPAEHVMKVVQEAALNPENYKYSLTDTQELKDAVKNWYDRRYDVTLNDDEIMSINGSQEGFAHVAMTVCNPGDLVLVPNPGYPIFEVGPYLEKLVEFAKKYNILVVHDNAYSEIEYDGRRGFSFLSIPGAKDVGIEFNSLSKTYNLTGLRISFALGNADVIKHFKTIRSQFDYGTSYIVQKAAVAALNGPQDGVVKQQAQYQSRRDALCDGLNAIGWKVPYSEGTMFVWAPVPKQF